MKTGWILIGAITLLGIALLCAAGSGSFIGSSEIRPNQTQLNQIYSAVVTGKLKPDASGVIVLPHKLASATVDGNVYVTRRKNLLMVLFPTWLGKGSNLRGYLCCNRSLASGEKSITIFAPGAWGGPATPSEFRVPPNQRKTEVVLEKQLENTTFYVSRSLD